MNGPNLASHSQHWALTDYGSGWDYRYAFFTDGTGAFRSNPGLNPGTDYSFTWVRNGPASLSISGPAIMGFDTLTAIAGSTGTGQFTAELDGNPTDRTFSLTSGTLSGAPSGTGSGTVFVTDVSNSSVRVFDRATLSQIRSFSGGNTEVNRPVGIALHEGRGEIFVANAGSNAVTVHAIGTSGNVAVLRRIQGPDTGLDISQPSGNSFDPSGLAVDPVNDEIYVACGTSVRVFAITASGNAMPTRVIEGPATGLLSARCVEVDPVNNEVFVGNLWGPSIVVFARLDGGNAAPVRELTPVSSEGIFGLAVDLAAGELWVARTSASQGIQVFARTAAGSTAALRSAVWTARGVDADPTTGDHALTRTSAPGTLEVLAADFGIRAVADVGGSLVAVALGP